MLSVVLNKLGKLTKLCDSYYTRHYQSSTGTEAANWLFNKVKSIASANSGITVQQFKHRFNQPSVIAKIPGETNNLGKSSLISKTTPSFFRLTRPQSS